MNFNNGALWKFILCTYSLSPLPQIKNCVSTIVQLVTDGNTMVPHCMYLPWYFHGTSNYTVVYAQKPVLYPKILWKYHAGFPQSQKTWKYQEIFKVSSSGL